MNAPASDRITLYHRRHATRQRAKGLAHLAPALVLLGSIVGWLDDEPFSALMAAEIVVGAAYVLLLVRELRHLRHHPHHRGRVEWLELAGAGILALEGYHIWHRHHEAELAAGASKGLHLLPWLYWVLAGVYVLMAFQMRRLDALRFLHLHDAGVSIRTKPFGQAVRLNWDNIERLEPTGEADLNIYQRDGQQRRVSFAPLHDGPALRDKVVAFYQLRRQDQDIQEVS